MVTFISVACHATFRTEETKPKPPKRFLSADYTGGLMNMENEKGPFTLEQWLQRAEYTAGKCTEKGQALPNLRRDKWQGT